VQIPAVTNQVSWPHHLLERSAFEHLISVLTSSEVLAYTDYTLPFVLHIDAPGTGLGAVLCQISAGAQGKKPMVLQCMVASLRAYPILSSPRLLGQPSLQVKDLLKLQQEDSMIVPLLLYVRNQTKPTQRQMKAMTKKQCQLAREWTKLCLLDGVISRETVRWENSKPACFALRQQKLSSPLTA
jgi:hypothetical protein